MACREGSALHFVRFFGHGFGFVCLQGRFAGVVYRMSLVLFFDGECGFCNRSVRVVNRLDRKGVVDFAPLQGEMSRGLGLEGYAEKGGGTMVILREGDGEMFYRSDALIALGKELGGVWEICGRVLGLVPKGMRDGVYDLVARNRYRLAGKGGVCEVPDEGLRKRMRG